MNNKIDKEKTEETVAVVKNQEGEIVGYLRPEHEEKGLDIELDMAGYTIESI